MFGLDVGRVVRRRMDGEPLGIRKPEWRGGSVGSLGVEAAACWGQRTAAPVEADIDFVREFQQQVEIPSIVVVVGEAPDTSRG